MMTKSFLEDTKQLAKQIIELSYNLDDELETWRDIIVRVPDSTSKDVSVGYVSKPDASSGLELVLDIQAPPNEDWARLRIWAIETTKDEAENERFNNIQLTFSLDKTLARQYVEQQFAMDRNELKKLLDNPSVGLQQIVISDMTGKDNKSAELLGERHEVDSDALDSLSEADQAQLLKSLSIIYERLKKTAEGKQQ